MEGGVAILLLLVLAVVIAGFVFGFSSIAGALGLRRAPREVDASDEGRPTHTRPTTPAHENTEFVGVDRGDDAPDGR